MWWVWTYVNTNNQGNRHFQYLPKFLCFPFFVIRTFEMAERVEQEIYSLNTFRDIRYCIVNYRYYAAEQISRTYSSSKTETLYSLHNFPYFYHRSPGPSDHYYTFHPYEFDYFWYTSYKWNHVLFVFLWLVYFIWNVFQVHSVA